MMLRTNVASVRKNSDCDDDVFCNGAPTCGADGMCDAAIPIFCPEGKICNEEVVGCVAPAECTIDADCDDTLFCTGAETCGNDGLCVAGPGDPCESLETCNEGTDSCGVASACVENADCDDILYCTGVETCVGGVCVDGQGNPCAENETCDEQNEKCIPESFCETDADCDGDALFCNGIEVCVLDASRCESPGNPCEEGETCSEESNSCEAVIGGSIAIDKAKVKAGKNPGTDSIELSGSIDATSGDLNAAGGEIIVSLTADDLAGSGVIEYSFPIAEENIKKGKYKSPKPAVKADPVTKLTIDTNKGTIKFSAKKDDLTGLSCPITVMVEIGAYAAETEVGEDIVNGTKPSPF